MTLKMTTAQVVETSVTVTNSSFQNYTHPDDHTTRTINNSLVLDCWITIASEESMMVLLKALKISQNCKFEQNSGKFLHSYYYFFYYWLSFFVCVFAPTSTLKHAEFTVSMTVNAH